jgi:hypothetical protein
MTDMVGIASPLSNGRGVATADQDLVTFPLDNLFAQELSPFTLAVDTVASGLFPPWSYDFTASAGHGIAPLDEILLLDPSSDRSFYAQVLNTVANVITVDRPIDFAFPAAATLGRIINTNLAVNGSVTPQVFALRAGTLPLDYTRFIFTIRSNGTMDDSLFGDLTALTRGLIFRIYNGRQKTVFNFKNNQDMQQFSFDFIYSDKAPAGQTGCRMRLTWNGKDKHGVALRVSSDDWLIWGVQDDLTGLISARMSAMGHETEGEV